MTEMVKELALTQGLVAFVDDEDFERLSKYKWCAGGAKKCRYAQRRSCCGIVYLHHDVLQIDRMALDGKVVDHIDMNRLNNCKTNLRIVSPAENSRNTKRHLERVGYCFDKTHGKWKVYLDQPDKKRINLGTVKTKEEAIELLERGKALCKAGNIPLWKRPLTPRLVSSLPF
jgi:hypothetical protein